METLIFYAAKIFTIKIFMRLHTVSLGIFVLLYKLRNNLSRMYPHTMLALSLVVPYIGFRDVNRVLQTCRFVRTAMLRIIVHMVPLPPVKNVVVDERCVNRMFRCSLCTARFPTRSVIREKLTQDGMKERKNESRLCQLARLRENIHTHEFTIERLLHDIKCARECRKNHLVTILSAGNPGSADSVSRLAIKDLIQIVFRNSNGRNEYEEYQDRMRYGDRSVDRGVAPAPVSQQVPAIPDPGFVGSLFSFDKNSIESDDWRSRCKMFVRGESGFEPIHDRGGLGMYCHDIWCVCTANESRLKKTIGDDSSYPTNWVRSLSDYSGLVGLVPLHWTLLCKEKDWMPIPNSNRTCFFDSDYWWWKTTPAKRSKEWYVEAIGPKPAADITYEEYVAPDIDPGESSSDYLRRLLGNNDSDSEDSENEQDPFHPSDISTGWHDLYHKHIVPNPFLRSMKEEFPKTHDDKRIVFFTKRAIGLPDHDPFDIQVWIQGNDFDPVDPDRDSYTVYVSPLPNELDMFVCAIEIDPLGTWFRF